MTKAITTDSQVRVSIIVPVFHGQDTVERCINSIKKQKFQGFELIILDDGSKDSTYKVISTLGVHALRHIINRGQGAALKTGIDYALGEGADIIVTFDADG